jgi:hypothetical protein
MDVLDFRNTNETIWGAIRFCYGRFRLRILKRGSVVKDG